VLLADIVRVLDEFEPLEPRAKQQLRAVSIDFSSVLIPRLERAVAERARPFVLVIDDAHRLRRRAVWALVQALADCLPAGSQLVLIGRTEPDLALGRMRADRRVHTVTTEKLAMDRDETAALFAAVGISLSASALDALWDRAEGWPVGLYLATLALVEEADPERAAREFAGDDRLVVDYVRDELLGVLPRGTRDFLLRAWILDELNAEICDTVLERDDAAKVLAEAARSSQLLIPLDRRGASFRMHELMRDTLRAELARRNPDLVRSLHERAAVWHEAAGDFDRAVEHRMAAGDASSTEALIWRATPRFAGAGRTATVERWLDAYPRDHVAARPALTVARAWCALTVGDMPSLRFWAAAASRFPGTTTLPDGTPVAAAAALLRAVVGGAGIEQHALFLVSMLSTVAPWITVEARIFLARAFLLLGDVALARLLVREGQELVALVPDGDLLRHQLAELERSAGAEDVPLGALAAPMTPAEMRVLRYLPTHLTFAAIAEELFVSRNTVKTQAISIHRKLGVSSRDPAVVAARALGLLEQ
jgi:LuxR family transcriptional regulator, maltose regulon positive regulatory protein